MVKHDIIFSFICFCFFRIFSQLQGRNHLVVPPTRCRNIGIDIILSSPRPHLSQLILVLSFHFFFFVYTKRSSLIMHSTKWVFILAFSRFFFVFLRCFYTFLFFYYFSLVRLHIISIYVSIVIAQSFNKMRYSPATYATLNILLRLKLIIPMNGSVYDIFLLFSISFHLFLSSFLFSICILLLRSMNKWKFHSKWDAKQCFFFLFAYLTLNFV